MITPIAWTIAGLDTSGGAGVTSDMLTFQHFNVHGCIILSALTAQNASQVNAVYPVPAEQLNMQFDALKHSYAPHAVKIGMLGSDDAFDILISYLDTFTEKVVLDPVLVSTSGQLLCHADKTSYIQKLMTLFPLIDVLTPNLTETEVILNRQINTDDDVIDAANAFLALGVKSVYIKGGHGQDQKRCHDYWTNGVDSFWLSSPRYQNKNYRGTGCVFSSALTACLAMGYVLKDALIIAKMYINRGIRCAKHHTTDTAMIFHAAFPDDVQDLPDLVDQPMQEHQLPFPSCGSDPIGLYPVVDKSEWLDQLIPLGVKTIQLRIKYKTGAELEAEIKRAVQLANKHKVRLFINDYWEMAIACGAYGVHLGQDDLTFADINKIKAAGLRLGISTHSFYEAARAYVYRPSYIACGPIFHTTSKIMPFNPQGIEKLHYWRRLFHDEKIVAIGGIHEENIKHVINTNVDGIAMISAITQAENPEQQTLKLLSMMSNPNEQIHTAVT